MGRKVIIDCDMGTDDAVALCMLMFDARVEVLAVTATEGCVTADQANNNLQAIVAELDPDRYPRIGMAVAAENAPPVNTRYLYGEDGLGNSGFEVSRLQHSNSSDKMIIDLVRAHPDEVTLICLGPMTNVAKAFQRDPVLPTMINRIIMTGGSLSGIGNVTACSEFNFSFDPESARVVLNSKSTKTLLPLDVTNQVKFGLDMLDQLPSEDSRIGYFLRQVLPFAFRAFRQQLGQETITLNDVVGALSVVEPELFTYEKMFADVETQGELTRGFSVFDQRSHTKSRPNLEVATAINAEAARQYIIDQLTLAGNLSS